MVAGGRWCRCGIRARGICSSSDVDLNDGSMQRSHEAYIQRLKFTEKIGLRERITLHPDITTLESG